ncbi:hypothetical protein Zmor_006010 [Zophobas morio]|uniref:Endonuclease/exonuclease/phosphatase domain-containing protein n=1 Tax=Zophobas morio TaxID=2755281 RepID=A0AA38IQY0_9CUCU|nr:hypothetical protein Zmor_006010 [Zophobas morio]
MALKVIQANVNRATAAQDLVMHTAVELDSNVIAISKPNNRIVSQGNWFIDETQDTAIQIIDKPIGKIGKGKGFMYVEIEQIIIYSCYISPNLQIPTFESYLETLGNDLKKHKKHLVLTGDFNAKSPEWGSKTRDRRGKIMEEWIVERKLVIINKGDTPTIVRKTGKSWVDLTLSTENIAKSIENWQVEETESGSDHQYITFDIKGIKGKNDYKNKVTTKRRWNLKTLDEALFETVLKMRAETRRI